MATVVSIREFSHAVGAWVDRAHSGEIVMITRQGRPWARLVPELSQTGSDYLDQLLVEGRVTLPTSDFSEVEVPPATGGWDGRDAADVVSELRDDRP
jgi:antitoxin (DNA-binding transcriptional repressor) of toxin-antitoxin stability system